MGEVTLTDVKYQTAIGVSDPLSLDFWADYVDPDYLRELAPIMVPIVVFFVTWWFIMPIIVRKIEKSQQIERTERTEDRVLFVIEIALLLPLLGVLGIIFALVFAFTAESRICMLCATEPDKVRGFGGGFCAYTDELKDSLREDNATNCIFVKESIFGPGRRTWMQMSSGAQVKVSTQQIERKFTGTKGVHKLQLAASNRSDSEWVTLLNLEQNDTNPLSPFNETKDAIRTFAESESEPIDFAGSLGWGKGKLYMRASRETVQLIVFRQDEMVCAFCAAIGVAILISAPWMETCEFDRNSRAVLRERWFLAPMSWALPTRTPIIASSSTSGNDILLSIQKIIFDAPNGKSTGMLTLLQRAGKNQSMKHTLREITRSVAEEEILRIHKYLYTYGTDVYRHDVIDLTDEEKALFEDITVMNDGPEDDVSGEQNMRRGRKGSRK